LEEALPHWQGVWQSPSGGLGTKPEEFLRHEAEKQTTYGEKKNKSIQTDIE